MPQVDISTQKTTAPDVHSWNKQVTHPLQSWQWGEFRKAMGIDVVRIHGWQLTFHRIPYTPWCIGYFPKGPKPTPSMLEQLKKTGREHRAIFIQLEPNTAASTVRDNYPVVPSHRPLFTKYTFVLDLKKSEEELLQSMHSKTRYNLRVAQKHNVTVREDNSNSAFGKYLRLTEETTGRQGFTHTTRCITHDVGIHETSRHCSSVYRAISGITLAAWIIFAWNKLYYPYGASSRLHREVMARRCCSGNSQMGKANGYESFDLWGALGPNPT